MSQLSEVRARLDEINAAISAYDPVLKEKARDILLQAAFGEPTAQPAPSDDPPVQGAAGSQAGRRRGRRPAGGREGAAQKRADRPDLALLLRRWHSAGMAEKALLGAYYIAQVRGNGPITSQAINSELKKAGHPISNITRAIEANLRSDRPLMVQGKKMGTTKQARKQYSITPAGVALVEQKLGITS